MRRSFFTMRERASARAHSLFPQRAIVAAMLLALSSLLVRQVNEYCFSFVTEFSE